MSEKNGSRHNGQLPLDGIEQSLDDAIRSTNLPKGMPVLSVIKSETKKYGLTDEDAEYIFDIWCMNGFTLRGGKKIKSWESAIRVWARHEYFPSQKKRMGSANWKPPTLDQVKAYCSRKRWAVGFARHCYNVWLGNNWRHYGQPIQSDEQWKALMESMEYKP